MPRNYKKICGFTIENLNGNLIFSDYKPDLIEILSINTPRKIISLSPTIFHTLCCRSALPHTTVCGSAL